MPVKTWVYNVPLCLETAYKDRKHEMSRLKGCGGFILGFWDPKVVFLGSVGGFSHSC